MICLREPSLGPVFGTNGGVAGGERAWVMRSGHAGARLARHVGAGRIASMTIAMLPENSIAATGRA